MLEEQYKKCLAATAILGPEASRITCDQAVYASRGLHHRKTSSTRRASSSVKRNASGRYTSSHKRSRKQHSHKHK